MSISNFRRAPGASALALVVTACGGGGGGANVASIPPTPVVPPAPTPPSLPVIPPVPNGPIGLQAPGSFKTYSGQLNSSGTPVSTADGVQFSYSSADSKYTISLPGFAVGQLVTTGANGSFNDTGWTNISSTVNEVTGGPSTATQPVRVILSWPASSDLKFTSTGSWVDPNWRLLGTFAYGTATTAGDIPVSGAATYAGSISGLINNDLGVWGSVSLNFNFGAGTLSGAMKPEFAPIWDAISLGTYTFRDTVYSTGSTNFSGAFQVPGSTAASGFQGSFTGPQGSELMASWNAPFLNPLTNEWGTMSGIWTAKRP